VLDLVAEEAGIRLGASQLQQDCQSASALIAATVAEQSASAAALDAPTADPHGNIPPAFFVRNEGFRGLLADGVASAEYEAIGAAGVALCEAVHRALEEADATPLHDIVNNCINFRPQRGSKGTGSDKLEIGKADENRSKPARAVKFEPARDRNRKLIANRVTTAAVRKATEDYLAACEDATRAAREALQKLCDDLHPLLPALVTAAHWSLFSTTLSHHVGHALSKGWGLPELRSASDGDRTVHLDSLWPYWMARERAVANSFTWEGIWLLTAPNMAGKSSLMRSITVAALLSNAGLHAPVAGGTVPRFDAFFLRTASFDVPAEGKSSFAMEMDDVRVMTSECGPRSLIMLDELGRGTSSKEGSALGTALLEWLDAGKIPAIFATHLHEIEEHLARNGAPKLHSLSRRCLLVEQGSKNSAGASSEAVRMTYQLIEGVCNHSLALHVARRAGLPTSILDRAEALMAQATAEREGSNEVDLEARLVKEVREQAADTVVEADAAADDAQLRAASAVLAEVCGSEGIVHVAANWQPPPRLSGRSCVYVLQLRPTKNGATGAAAGAKKRRPPTKLYVGESDAIHRRLQQHRRAHSGAHVECMVCEVESKTQALEFEATTIRRLKELHLGRVTNVAKA